jgi:hypothetical protein
MHRFVPVLSILLPGLLTAEILAFIQIQRCMDPVIHNAINLEASGILTVPHGPAIATLAAMDMGLFAALLFVLSVGAGLTLITFTLAWASCTLVPDRRWITFPAAGLWVGLLFFVNQNGPVLFPSLWALLIPPITWKSTVARMPQSSIHESPFHKLAHLIPLVILACAALPLLGKGMFIDIRDSLLLSSRTGLAISDAYYRYTLPAAEVIKPIAARQLKTYTSDIPLSPQTEEELRAWGWHRTQPGLRPHIHLRQEGEHLMVSGSTLKATGISKEEFAHAPGKALNTATLDGDRMGPFRSLILFCLVPGFPILLYALAFCPLRRIFAWIFDRPTASFLASLLCLLTGLSLLLPLYFLGEARKGPQKPEVLNTYLFSEKRSERLHAMRAAAKGKKLDVSETVLRRNLEGKDPAERYWTVTFLGSRPSETHWELLLQALNDPNPNVVCKTVEALSLAAPRLHQTKMAQEAILRTLRASEHPYVQWYAFQALKRLGPLPRIP